MKINSFHTLNGYFFVGQYEEYNEETESYQDPISVRYKQNDEGTQGVSSGGKRRTVNQRSQGRDTDAFEFTIKVVQNLPYKPRDVFKLQNEDTRYSILEVYEDVTTTNSIRNLQFKRTKDDVIYVLKLGQLV